MYNFVYCRVKEMAENRFKNDEFEDIFSSSPVHDEFEDIYSSSSDNYDDLSSASEDVRGCTEGQC
jgi:hypothetical protein